MTIPEDNSPFSSDQSSPPTHIPPTPLLSPEQCVTDSSTRLPASVIIIAILFIIGAVAELSGFFDKTIASPNMRYLNKLDSLVFAFANILTGLGLLQRRAMARVGAMYNLIARYVTEIPLTLWSLKAEHPTTTWSTTIGVTFTFIFLAIYFAILLFFLNRPAVKEACIR